MGSRDDAVRARWRELLPTAYLLTGDQATARQLVVRALARWRRAPGDRDDALAALVRTHRSRWQITGRGAIHSTPVTPWWSSPEDTAAALRLAEALALLDRDERTAVVLRWFEDRPPEQVAHLVPGPDPEAAARRLPGDPAELPRRLDDLASLCDLGSLDDDTVVAAVRGTAARRTRRVVLAAASVAVTAAAVTWLPSTVDQRGTNRPAVAPSTTATAPLQGIFALPPRGALADDDELLRGLQQRLTAEGVDAAADYRVLYADDVEGVRAVLMIHPVGTRVEMAWLTGRAGGRPTDLGVARLDDSGPEGSTVAAVSVEDPAGGPARLVVLTEDGTDVTVSPGVDVDPATGTPGRSFDEVPAPDGVAAVTLDRTTGAGVRYYLSRPGLQVTTLRPTSVAGWFTYPVDEEPPRPSRSGSPAASFVYATTVATITGATGWTADDLDVVVLGAGTLPTPGGGTTDVVSVAAVLPGGAVVTTTGTGSQVTTQNSTSSTWSSCGSSSYPAGTDPAGLVVAATCRASAVDGTGFDRVVVVSAPPGRSIVLTTPTGDAVVEPQLVDGFGWSPYLAREDLSTGTDGDITFPVAGPGNDALPD